MNKCYTCMIIAQRVSYSHPTDGFDSVTFKQLYLRPPLLTNDTPETAQTFPAWQISNLIEIDRS